jgi:4-hydroxybenzoate polyprenyltransferase/phosphoserine phosphatase
MSIRAVPSAVAPECVPLVVDVDGTLIATDLLHEAMLRFIASFPREVLLVPGWIAAGKSNLKSRLADRVNPGIDTVPLREGVLDVIRAAQASGRPVYLASASDRRYVDELAERVGGIAGVFGTEAGVNLAGKAKADRLVAAFGEKGYDYIGDTPVDFDVWRSARKPLVVARSDAFADSVMQTFPDAEVISRPRIDLKSCVRALRVHQWAKNVLLFLPMIAGHRFDIATIAPTLLGFFCFSFAASSAYIFNDLLDLPGDREHPRKRSRPFAAGAVPIPYGIVMSLGLAAAAFGLSLFLPLRFTGILLLYIASTLAYSLVLKRRVLIDVVTLGGLYTLRVYGGLAATNEYETQWLLMFSLFLFLSLAIVKRSSEIVTMRAAGKTGLKGRGYRVADLSVLMSLGAAAGYGAVFVVALYLSSPEVIALYGHSHRMWLICPLLIYWISRMLLLSNRGDLHHDPVIFALTDRASWITGACVAVVIAASI